MVGIISVVIGSHFGGGDHFDGGDHFGGGTWSEQARFFRDVARIFPEVPTNFQNPSPKLLKAPNIFLVPSLKREVSF